MIADLFETWAAWRVPAQYDVTVPARPPPLRKIAGAEDTHCRSADGSRNVHRTGIVSDVQRRTLQQSGRLRQVQLATKHYGAFPHQLGDAFNRRKLGRTSGQD